MNHNFLKNLVIGILLLILTCLSFVWITTPKITDIFVGTPTMTDINNMVTIDGAWLPPTIPSEDRAPAGVLLTNTNIVCDKVARSCKESRAVINRLDKSLNMQAWTFEYSIQDWGDEFIIANVNLPLRTDELRINHRQKSATLIQTEKNTNTAAPQAFVWELVGTDKAIKRFKELYK